MPRASPQTYKWWGRREFLKIRKAVRRLREIGASGFELNEKRRYPRAQRAVASALKMLVQRTFGFAGAPARLRFRGFEPMTIFV